MMYLTGMKNIRDVIPFPRTPGSVPFDGAVRGQLPPSAGVEHLAHLLGERGGRERLLQERAPCASTPWRTTASSV